jgi:nicotinic acid phosphoribosyltransferase
LAKDRSSDNAIYRFFGRKTEAEVSGARATTANEALAMIEALQQTEQEIKFIRSPQEGEIGIEMLLVLAKEEQAELPIAPLA